MSPLREDVYVIFFASYISSLALNKTGISVISVMCTIQKIVQFPSHDKPSNNLF